MQLILECESTRVIHKDMSSIEEPLSEKIVANGDIKIHNHEKLNRDKENLAEGNIVITGEETDNIHFEDKAPQVEESVTDEFETKEEAVSTELSSTQNGFAVDDAQIEESRNDVIEVPESVRKNIEKDLKEIKQEDLINQNLVNGDNDSNVSDTEIADNNVYKTENTIEDIEKEQDKKEVVSTAEETNNVITGTSENALDNVIVESKKIENDITNIPMTENVEETANVSILKCDIVQHSEVEHKVILNEVQEEKNAVDLIQEEEIPEEIEMNKPLEENELTNTDSGKFNNQTEQVPTVELKDDMEVEEIKDDVVDNKNYVQEIIQPKNEDSSAPIEIDEEEVKEVGQEKSTESSDVRVLENDVAHINEGTAQKDEMDIEEIKDNAEDTNLKCDNSDVNKNQEKSAPIELKDEMDVEEIKDVEEIRNDKIEVKSPNKSEPTLTTPTYKSEAPICKLSNTLDILSDDDDDDPPPKEGPQEKSLPLQDKEPEPEKQCINIEDDDDIMVIDDVSNKTEKSKTVKTVQVDNNESAVNSEVRTDLETGEVRAEQDDDLLSNTRGKDLKPTPPQTIVTNPNVDIDIKEKTESEKTASVTPLLPESFLKTAKKNISDMTRDELEEFCVLKIVESIVDKSNLGEIKTKLKNMAQSIEEYKKKAFMLTKQNRDLQVVLKSVQEEQKKMTDLPITPLKITRSVGMQVLMTDKAFARKKGPAAQATNPGVNTPNKPNLRIPAQSPRLSKQSPNNQSIPVPRLVPANSPATKTPSTMPQLAQMNTPSKTSSPTPNGIKNPQPAQKAAEKRQHNRIQSVTVDLTDDEPPNKIINKNSPAPPVRLVPPQSLMAPQRQQFSGSVNSPRKVYIPISGPPNQNIRPGQTIMLKAVQPGARPRCTPPQMSRMPNNTVRMSRVTSGRHPAPLPDAMKQYQPPNWKALPPAPDLRLSKVENGIVISWKIEGYQEDSYEEIASYQLYAYQETSSPPSTSLWKKIGDVKALPLPMACTLTQFMAGFKYYFAVRAVDVKSRLGPFSLPGSILLLNKL